MTWSLQEVISNRCVSSKYKKVKKSETSFFYHHYSGLHQKVYHSLMMCTTMPCFEICSVPGWPRSQNSACLRFLWLKVFTTLSRPKHLIATMTQDLDQNCVSSHVKMWIRSLFLKDTDLDNKYSLHYWMAVYSREGTRSRHNPLTTTGPHSHSQESHKNTKHRFSYKQEANDFAEQSTFWH